MKTTNPAWYFAIAAALLLTLATASVRAADDKNAILARMKERLPALQQAKTAGTIGEVWNGTVEAVKAAGNAANLVAAENADRQQLYAIVAKETGATADAVAQKYAEGFFKRAARGEYLKGKDGVWRQKA